ncbi:PLxRFG domain-containing protein [Paracoccus marcusii]|uniref:PLxRFG domain-containing protein n=1 Tax=Paracoccus marcusii TaxID=59779 RepID=UPI0024929411|nr:PLxRFG domain-containing protein [Paracoccus marcusii]
MASNVFAPRSPADIYQESLGVRQKAVDPKQKLEAASARHGVPVNVLLAVAEADGDTDLANIEATAHDLGAAIAGGSDLKKALEVKTGDPDRARAIGQRANQLLDILQPQAAPAPKADNGSVEGDLARQFGGTAVSGIGGAVDALGIAAEQGVGRTEKGEFRRFGERVGESIRGAGEALTDSVSDAGKAALQGSTPDGDISDPSSWTLGDEPSARGYAMQLAGVLGSMAPVVAASVLTRNPAVAAAAGGAQGGGAGAAEARQSVLDMAEQMDADGAPMLGKAPAYQKAIAEGLDHTAALQRTADEAARQAFNWTAPVSGLGGAATQRIIAPVERRVSGSIAGAIAGRAALSGAEEATQEVAEGIATRHGTNEATGLDGDLFEGSFGNAILGALGGGAVGAASGAMDRRESDAAPAPAPAQVPPAEPGLTQIEAQPRPLALPAPVPPTAEDTPDVVVTPPPAPRGAGPLGIRKDARPLMIEGPRDPASAEVAPDVIVTPPPTGPRPTAPLGIRAQEPPLMIGGPREPASAETAPGIIVPPAPEAKVHPGFEKPYVGSGSAPMGPVAPGPVSQQAVGAAPIPAPSMGDPLGIMPAPALAPEPAPIPAPPVGSLSAAVSQLAPAPIAAPAPEPRFPDQKAGSSVRLAGTDGAVGDGVFIRETPEGQAVVRVDGEEYTLSPSDFDRARGEATRIDEEAKAATKGQAAAKGSEPEPAFPISDLQVGGRSETVAKDNANFVAEMPDNGQDYQNAPNRVAAPAPAPETGARQQPTIEPIRAKAAILRGVPENAAPDVPGISLKWDAKESGFIFSRQHVDKVQAALGAAPANPEALTFGQDPASEPHQPEAAAPIATAAADVAPAPIDAQKEAGNYKKGHARWNGLDLTVESAKGQERTGTDPNGRPWSVTMPADYGYVRRTEGADGDHVDFYMGPNEASDAVFVIDQFDADTGKFDEHKVMLGFDGATEAKAAYREAFSDGRAQERMGGVRKMSPDEFKAWLKDGDTKVPASAAGQRKAKQPVKDDAAENAARRTDAEASRTANDARLVREAQAMENLAIDRSLPGRQAALPMARIRVGQAADGRFMVDMETNTAASGMGTPMDGKYGTAAEAEAAAISRLTEWATRLSSSRSATDGDRKDATKILEWLGAGTADAAPVSVAPGKPANAKKSPKALAKERADAIRDYFTPGNVVSSYGGGTDRVLSYSIENGNPAIRVEAVRKEGNAWVKDGEPRTHSTTPEARQLARGPVERVTDQEPKAPAQPNQKNSPNAQPEAATGNIEKSNNGPSVSGIAATTIKADTAITARGREVSVDYAIVELADLIPSQRDDGRDNPAYPQELQPRDRSTNKSQEQVRKIASGLKPALLGESPQASNGAPIILPTGEVLSGNGRTLALRAAYADDGRQARAYRDFMDAQGYPEGRHRQPVLVRIVTDPMTMTEAATFAREANERDQADMSVPEQAMADAKNLTPAVLDLYRGGDVDSVANAGFVKAFGTAVLSPNDAGRMRDNDGRMTQDALRRINAALLAKAYGDAGIVSSVLESTDTNIKSIGGALTDAAPLWAQMRAEVERGTIAADADRTADLVEAVKLVDRARRENRPLSDFLNQTDMFAGDSVSPGAVAFLGLLYRDAGSQPFRRALGRDKMAEGLTFYAGEALKTTPGVDLLGESADTQAILTTAKGRINDQQEQSQDLFGQRSDTGGGPASSGGGRTGSGSQIGESGVREQGGSGPDQDVVARPDPATQPAKIQDFGEKIGGARKDIAEPGIKRGAKTRTEGDEQPAWRRQYRVTQIAASMRTAEKGKWTITDEKSGRPLRNGYTTALFDTADQAEAAVPLYVVATKHRVYAENDGTHAIYRRVTDRKRVLMQGGFPDRAAADRYMAENAVQLIETNTRIDDSIHPALEEAIRDGDARREGNASVTPADFSEVFGFRAVEFGNWNNAAERQHILNQAYDAFLDMAEILQIPPKAVSLNGELALAFGARGSGLSGARAHYERNYGVINLTKIQGAGALAHEWWHALDHYLGRQDGKASSTKITNERGDTVWDAKDQTKDYASHGFLMRGSKVRPEVRAAMEKMVNAVFQRKAEFTEDVSTRERIAERQVADLERTMKQFRDQLANEQQWGRKKSPATTEQLAKIDRQFDRIRRQDYGDKQLAPSKGMSSLMLSDPVMKIMEVFKAVRGRQGYGMHQGRMVGEIHDLQRAIDVKEQSDRVLADAKEQRVKEKTVRTEFYSEAWKLDQGRTGDYWNTNHEMTARAFEAFIYDRLQDVEARNDFLSYEKHNNLPQYLMFNVKPYPEGKERQDMNAAFEQLFSTFQTRETDQGIELFQQDMSKPDAIVSGDELGAWEDIRQLGKKAEAWYRSNLVGRDPVINRETGWEIQFDATGARKTGGRKGDVLYRLVPALPAILENGRVISSEPDSRGRKEIRAVHKLSARVMMGGQEYFVVAAIREKADGTYHYDLSMDRRASGFSTATVQEQRSRTSALEGDSADINLELADPSVNGTDGKSLSPAQARAINAAARTELALVGLLGKIGLRVEAGRLAGPTGSYSQGVVSILRKGSQGWRHTLDHEIVHALRDPARWGGTHGLFTADEWRAMVRSARADAGIRDRVEAAYPDLDAAGRAEEMVAELYADWAAGRREVDGGPLRQALDAIRSFFRAMASVLRGEGFQDAARIMEQIASGEVGGRGPDGPNGRPRDAQGRFTPAPAQATVREQRDMGAIREALTAKARKAGVAFGFDGWRKGSDFWSDLLTDTMSKSNKWNTLSLVPGRPLFKELGRNLMAAQAYTKHKDEMDAQRGEWHSRAAETADAWMKLRRKDSAANAAFMDLLHDATIAQVDPTKAFEARKVMANDPDAVAREAARRRSHVEMAQRFRALPPDFKDMWAKVRADYDAIGDAFEAAILKNMELAAEVAIRRAKRAHARRLEEIEDEGLVGAARNAAITEADAKLAKIESTAKVNGASRLTQLRKVFEANRLAGPYVPLARYGNFFVTVRDEKGAVTSFSMFETAGAQRAAVADAEKDAPGRVQHGVMTDKNALKQQVDPSFVADVEGILASTGATPDVMDAIWQRWLETLPDQSIRTSKIHRKGRKGYGKDALRAYGDHLFHGSHQLAKLEWGLRLEDDLDEATEEAKRQPDPNRAQAIVNEMKKRHDFTMNPEGSPLVAAASGMAFTLQLAASPAAALVNISQTTLVGVPMLAAQFPKATVPGILKHLTRASRDFTRARGFLETANVLTGDEKAAMVEAVRRGVIDKTQGHSLAELADHGVTHSPVRDQVTRALGFFFHHAERFNREVTFLTAYRLAKEAGMEHGDAVEAATDGTWASHFDVQNNARPRFMQNDLGKLLTVFKSFQVNLLWRMARDLHQTFNGATPELRREARLQFTGISLSMMAHAGIRGVWGYALITSMLALFLPGDDDDLDAWLQDALLFEGDSAPVTAWNFIMGAALNGAPGQITGTDLTNRIGMAELWFRAPYDGMRSSDIGWHYVKDLLGPSVGWAFGSIPQGLGEISEGEYWRGTERILPKAVRDPMKAMRYAWEGVETKDGDIILEDVSIQQMLVQASGFTPAQVSQRYRQAGLLRKGQREIETRRRSLHKAATDAMRAGKGIPEKVIDQIRAFNREVPEWPVTSETIRSSYRGREAAAGRAQIGVNINPRLTNRLNEALPQAVPTL